MSKLLERDVLVEPWFSITIAGKKMQEDMLRYVEDVEVTDEEEKFTETQITINDIDAKWANGISIGKGSSLVISLGHTRNNATVFRGKITMVEADYPEDGIPKLIIYGIDSGVEMMRNRTSVIHKNKRVSDVIKEMHKKAGLDITVEDTVTVFEHLPQTKETPAEFVHRWRDNLGWKYYKTPSGAYYFGRKNASENPLQTLGYRTGGMEIISFTPTFVDIETEESEDEVEIENKEAKPVISKHTKDYSKVRTSGSHNAVGKA